MNKLIYVCTPYRASTPEELAENIRLAKRVCKRVLSENYVPYAPHLFFPWFLDEDNPKDRKLGMDAGMKVLERCDGLYVSGPRISEGMAREIEKAASLGIPIKCVADPRFAEERLLREIIRKGEKKNEH